MTDEKPRVIIIPPKPEPTADPRSLNAAPRRGIFRVSTKKKNRPAAMKRSANTPDKIMTNKEWTMAGFFADEGITGTSTKSARSSCG